jgi:hypothetical protein
MKLRILSSLPSGQYLGQPKTSILGSSTAMGMLVPMEDAHVANAAENGRNVSSVSLSMI